MRPISIERHKFGLSPFPELIENISSSKLSKQEHQFSIHQGKQLNKTVTCIEQLNMTSQIGEYGIRSAESRIFQTFERSALQTRYRL